MEGRGYRGVGGEGREERQDQGRSYEGGGALVFGAGHGMSHLHFLLISSFGS